MFLMNGIVRDFWTIDHGHDDVATGNVQVYERQYCALNLVYTIHICEDYSQWTNNEITSGNESNIIEIRTQMLLTERQKKNPENFSISITYLLYTN